MRTAAIKGEAGEVLFEQTDCEVPASWSQLATNVVCSKYFYGESRHARAREQRSPVDPSRQPHDRRLGPEGRLLRLGRRRRAVLSRPDLALPASARRVQLARLVQRRPVSPVRRQGRAVQLALGRRDRAGRAAREPLRISARLGLLHPERAGQHGRHHGARPQRGHALQVRLGHRHRSVDACVRIAKSSPAAASPRARCRSCGFTTRSRRWSRAAARPAAPPRCSRSRSGIPT